MSVPVDPFLLTNTAHRLLIGELVRRGNQLSELHSAALYELVETMAMYAAGEYSGRKAAGLPTGSGKTTGIVAMAAACVQLGYDVPIAVSASRVEALISIRREMLAMGVPVEMIGIKHSQKDVSVESTGDTSYPIMLMTHERIRWTHERLRRGNKDLELLTTHEGQPRKLCVWDESLVRGVARAVNHETAWQALGALERADAYATRPLLQAAGQFMNECCLTVRQALDTLAEEGDPEGLGLSVTFSERTSIELDEYAAELGPARLSDAQLGSLQTLLEISQDPLRVLSTARGRGILWAAEAIPAELRNVLVLDASFPIRELIKFDPTIEDACGFEPEDLKTFELCEVHQVVSGGGRSSMNVKLAKETDDACREFVSIVQENWLTSQGVLLFTYKPRAGAPNMRAVLERALRDAGINLKETVIIQEAGQSVTRDKLQWRTWGEHESTNGLEFCDVCIMAGVIQRAHLDIAGAIQAQAADPRFPTPQALVERIVQAECCHAIYQGMSRGACRRVQGGKAGAMKLYLVHNSPSIKHLLGRVLPKVQWFIRQSPYLNPKRTEGVDYEMAARIIDHLRGISETVGKVSSKTIKRALGLTVTDAAAESAYKRATKLVDREGNTGWTIGGRGFVRWSTLFMETAG